MLICSTIFLEDEAIVISGSQKAVKIAKKVFRKGEEKKAEVIRTIDEV